MMASTTTASGLPASGVRVSRNRRKDGLSETALVAFRYLRDEGGWHRPTEVAEGIGLDGDAQRRNVASTRALMSLAARGHAVINPMDMDSTRPRYGVTARCVPPDGETMALSNDHTPSRGAR